MGSRTQRRDSKPRAGSAFQAWASRSGLSSSACCIGIDSTLAETWAWSRFLESPAPSSPPPPAQRAGSACSTRRLLRGADALAPAGFIDRPPSPSGFEGMYQGKLDLSTVRRQSLDQNGNEIGKRSILHNDAVLDDIPDAMVKSGVGRPRTVRFDHWGIDVLRHLPRAATNLQANDRRRRVARRSPSR